MKTEQLLDAIGKIDEELITDAAKYLRRNAKPHKQDRLYKSVRLPKQILLCTGTLAACLCLIAIGTLWQIFFMPSSDSKWTITPDIFGSLSQAAPAGPASDTYQNLEELLAYLSLHEDHGSRQDGLESGDTEINARGSASVEGAAVVTYADYAYHIGDNKVNISRLGNKNPENAGMINFAAEYLFLYENKLILAGSFGNTLSEEEFGVCVRLYDLTNPEIPRLQQEFTQTGQLSACYMTDGVLYLLTADGVCACGYSRLDDSAEYKPQLFQNGEAIAWEDTEICILGEPARIQYLAVSRIDINLGEINGKLALYGDIEEIFYGSQWLAVLTQSRTDTPLENVYTFAAPLSGFFYTGKIDLTSMMNPESVIASENSVYMYSRIRSITKSGDVYRLIGYCVSREKDNSDGSRTLLSARPMAATVDMLHDKRNYKLFDCENYQSSAIDDVIWEDNRAIISVSSSRWIEDRLYREENRFLFAEFSGMDISLYDNELTADHVAGIDGIVWYSSPFGNLNSFIPMGNGIYLRYNETPDGLDIYDFSQSSNPQCLYKSAGDIPETCRFLFTWKVYAEDIFGIMTISPDETGDFRNAVFSWNIYSLDDNTEAPYSLLATYNLGERSAFSDIGFAAFEQNGQLYYITRDSDTAVAMIRLKK